MTNEQKQQIYAWWNIFKSGNQLTEIRILGKYTSSGCYTNIENLIRDVEANESEGAVYFVINTMTGACYEKKQQEQMMSFQKISTTADKEIVGFDYIFLDIDCEKPTDTNSTDEEKAYAHAKALEIYNFLLSEGFNEPIVNDSANGYHIFIPCHLQNTPENCELIKKFTLSMGMRFGDERIKIDPVVANPARIAKLPGTYSFKGSEKSTTRPRRMCRILHAPAEIKPNDIAYIRKIANQYPEAEKPSRFNNFSSERFDLEAFIAKHNIPVTSKLEVADGTRYYLEHCLFNDQHKGKDAVLFQHKSGAVAYFCFHAGCQGNDWRKLREMYEPGCYERQIGGYTDRRTKAGYKQPEAPVPEVETEAKGKKWRKMSEIPRTTLDPRDYIPSGIQQLDDVIIGFKRKQVTLWSGYRGSAKSTVLNQIILNSANLGYKSALWTGELDDREVKTWLYLQAAGKQYNKPSHYNNFYYTPADVAAKIDPWIDQYFLLYNNEYSDNYSVLEQEIRDVVKAEGVDMVFLDNLTIMDTDDLASDKYECQKQLMKRLTRMAKDLNIHVHIVAHPNKSGGFLRPNSISGSGHLPDLAQNVMIIHRINRDFDVASQEFLSKSTRDDIIDSRCTNAIEICKCRDKGSATDTFIQLHFEIESNRLKNSPEEHIRYKWEEDTVQLTITPPAPREEEFDPFPEFGDTEEEFEKDFLPL